MARLIVLIGIASIAGGNARLMMDNDITSMQVRGSEMQESCCTMLGPKSCCPSAEFVQQPQDHFDSSNSNTWWQAFYVNDTFFVPGSDAPVFLCVGGEGPPIDGSAVVDSVHCNVAVEFLPTMKALMFAVEHRYYGCHNASACPYNVESSDPADLRFLSSRQAVADLAVFHAHAMQKFGLTARNKWVSFGGSYPGMLASFSRMKLPDLIHAAVASSAPVHAAVDMPGYNDVTAEAYGLPSVGGSAACNASIAKGHAMIGEMFNTTAGRQKLARLFPSRVASADELKKREAQQQLAGMGVAMFPAQGNDPTCTLPACNIAKICAIMSDNATDEVQRLVQVAHAQETWRRGAASSPLLAAARGEPTGFDYWSYQTCAEWGFYQTCEVGSRCFYTQGLVVLSDYTSMCPKQFNISVAQVYKNIAASNAHYGGLEPLGPGLARNVSRILWPNGDVDPWHALSVLRSPVGEAEQPTLMVPGASHHAWTHPSAPTDQPSVVHARTAIREQVTKWLSEA